MYKYGIQRNNDLKGEIHEFQLSMNIYQTCFGQKTYCPGTFGHLEPRNEIVHA